MEFSELFTQSAQRVLPLARAKGLVSLFDYRSPNIELDIDADLVRAALHRLLLTLTEAIEQGFLTLTAEAAVLDARHCAVSVNAAGTGLFVTEPALVDVLERHGAAGLGVAGPDELHVQWHEPLRAQPAIDVALALHKARGEGLSLTWQATLPARLIEEPVPAQAHGAPAWLVSAIPGGLDAVEYRLRRQGGHVTALPSLQNAQALLDAQPPASRPMLLLVAESAQATLADMERLARLSPATWRVLAVLKNCATLQARGSTPVDIRVLPISRAGIDALTRHVDSGLSTTLSRQTAPAPHYAQAMRRVLAVDDHPVNQLVARALLERFQPNRHKLPVVVLYVTDHGAMGQQQYGGVSWHGVGDRRTRRICGIGC